MLLRGVYSQGNEAYREAFRIIAENPPELAALHTHEFKLEDAETALLTLGKERADGRDPICVTLHPSADNVHVMQIVTLKNVTKSYQWPHCRRWHLSLEIASGEIVALLGQTGAGKSTIMNMIMGQTGANARGNPRSQHRPSQQCARAAGLCGGEFSDRSAAAVADCRAECSIGLEYFGVPKTERLARARAG